MLQLDEDTYLSEIDDLEAATGNTDQLNERGRIVEAPSGSTSGFSTAKTTGELLTRNLFPHSPRKIVGNKAEPRVKSKVVVVNNNKSGVNRNSLAIKNQRRTGRETKRSDLKRVIKQIQSKVEQREKPRQVAFIARPPRSSHKPARPNCPPIFAHINQAIVNPLKSYQIPKRPVHISVANVTKTSAAVGNINSSNPIVAIETVKKSFVSVGVQTEQCKCQLRNQQKNRNRRLAAKRAKEASNEPTALKK